MGGFIPDFLQNITNGLSNIGIQTPELGWTEATGGANVAPNHSVAPNLDLTNTSVYGPYASQTNGANAGQDSSTASNGVASGITYSPQVLAQYDQGIKTLQSALDRSGTQLGIAQGNINNQFNTNQNELNTAKQNAQQSYDQSGVQNQQSLRTNKNQIADQASSGLRGLLRTLGAYGAGGSSDALYNAPKAVTDQASAQRAGAGNTFAQNQQNLDTNWNGFLNSDQTSRQKLNDWRTQQLNSAQAQAETTKQSLLQKLADLQGQRASAAGGSYASAAQPLLDQANSLSGSIDQLGAINPTYNGTTPTYTAPTLDSYLANADTKTTLGQGATQDVSPVLSALLGLGKRTGINGLGR